MKKDTQAPVPDRKTVDKLPADKQAEPKFVRGTIDPPTKKER